MLWLLFFYESEFLLIVTLIKLLIRLLVSPGGFLSRLSDRIRMGKKMTQHQRR